MKLAHGSKRMFGYYLDLALRSFRRNRVLTALMVLKLLSGDPLPQKSTRLFTAEIDPLPAKGYVPGQSKPPWGNLMPYVDAMSLLRAHKAERQAVMALTQAKVTPARTGEHPFFSDAVM